MKISLLNQLSGLIKAFPIVASLLAVSNAQAQCTTTISIDSTLACYGDTSAVLSLFPIQSGAPLMITEADRNSPDLIEIQNVTGAPFDATGYYVICSDDYSIINTVNPLTWDLTGIVPAGWIDFRDDNVGTNYWGNNLFFNSPSAGWVAICDPSHNIIDIFFWEWTAVDIATFAPIVAGNTLVYDPAQWVGDGLIGGCGIGSMTRSTNNDNNNALDWSCAGAAATPGVSNITITPQTQTTIVNITWSTSETTASIDDLGAGTYSVIVEDSEGCFANDTITITEPAQLVGLAYPTNILCHGDSTGTVMLQISGGTGAATVDWGTNDPTMLPSGVFTYTVVDSQGCSVSDDVTIFEPAAALELNLTAQSIPCFGDSTGGEAIANLSGGTIGYWYDWTSGDITNTASNLSAGWYTVSCEDANGCTVMDSIEITEPPMITLNGVTSDEIIGNDGSIDLTVAGGTMPYSYAWTNGAGSAEDPTGLAGGLYDVTITDGNGCVMNGTYIVNSQVGIDELNALQFSIFPNPNNGSFDISIDPSIGSINIEVLNSLGQMVYTKANVDSNHHINLQNVEAGIYFVRVFNSEASNVQRIFVK